MLKPRGSIPSGSALHAGPPGSQLLRHVSLALAGSWPPLSCLWGTSQLVFLLHPRNSGRWPCLVEEAFEALLGVACCPSGCLLIRKRRSASSTLSSMRPGRPGALSSILCVSIAGRRAFKAGEPGSLLPHQRSDAALGAAFCPPPPPPPGLRCSEPHAKLFVQETLLPAPHLQGYVSVIATATEPMGRRPARDGGGVFHTGSQRGSCIWTLKP